MIANQGFVHTVVGTQISHISRWNQCSVLVTMNPALLAQGWSYLAPYLLLIVYCFTLCVASMIEFKLLVKLVNIMTVTGK